MPSSIVVKCDIPESVAIMKKSVLITGANGFVGRHLLNALLSSDWNVTSLVHNKAGLTNEIVLDFCSEDFNTLLNTLSKVDVVVHLGAKIGWDDSSRQDFYVPNVLATAELVNWANKIGASFIFASTAIVCGAQNPCIISESKPNPDTDYGYSKWLAEELIKMSGVRFTTLRIAGVFGKHGPQHLGINKAIDNALNGEIPVQYGNGKIKRNYIYVKDLVDIITYCMENQIDGTHLVAGSSTNTIADMLQIICDKILPDTHPTYLNGIDGQDQVVTPSPILPKGRIFKDAIKDICKDKLVL